jgi:phage tail sheath protein FI
MPEYLHPGVYIEETSFRGKPIEGVSTSTAGLVGRTAKGPEGKPTLVTSFAQFQREFGAAFPITSGGTPKLGDYLGHAVRAFFENGGRRAYIVRVLHADALSAFRTLVAGSVWNVAANRVLRVGLDRVQLRSTRGLAPGDKLRLFTRVDPNAPFFDRGLITVGTVDVQRDEFTLSALTATQLGGASAPSSISISADNCYFVGTTSASGNPADPPSASGPRFLARYRGEDGNNIAVQLRPADRPAVSVRTATAAAGDTIEVASVGSFYEGAIVELTRGNAREYFVVETVNAVARSLTFSADTGGAVAVTDFVRTLEFDALVYENGVLKESFAGLTWNPDDTVASFTRNFAERINDSATGSALVQVNPVPPAMALTPAGQPTTPNGLPLNLSGGGNGSDLSAIDLIGTDGGPGNRKGIEALREVEDIALVAVPGVTDVDVQGALLVHCELLKYRFAVLDGLPKQSDISAIQGHRNHYDSKYGGYYTPWLKTLDLATGREMINPPSGYVLGICARVDNERGVHKAPANEVVRGVNAIELPFGDGEQDVLNPRGINLVRSFEGRGIRVWGGRTTSSDSEWKYVNIRRLFIYLEHSIDRGTQWVVFEPNNEALWQRVVETIDSFLFGVWKSGALMGTKPEDAYFVRCDRTTMTQDDIDNGRLVCLIGVAPAYPAEFVIFRIGQFTASSPSS